MAQPALHLIQHLLSLASTGDLDGRIAHHQHQVVVALEDGGAAEGLQQSGNVLATVRTADRQQGLSVGVLEKGVEPGLQSRAGAPLPHPGPRRIETARIDPRRNHPGPLRPEAGVVGVLLLQFLKGAGDHQRSLGEGEFLGLNAAGQGIAGLDGGRIQT
jgi:hypothetical protein